VICSPVISVIVTPSYSWSTWLTIHSNHDIPCKHVLLLPLALSSPFCVCQPSYKFRPSLDPLVMVTAALDVWYYRTISAPNFAQVPLQSSCADL